jgi:uncharacterized protein (TIGR03083 family)
VSTTESNLFPRIKAYERAEFDRLGKYLAALDASGWVEQSYCTDWRVYQVVSHIGSGSRIGALRLQAWVNGGPPVTREVMQGVWGYFDALEPEQMLAAYTEAVKEYLEVEAAIPDATGLHEVEGFAGRRTLAAYQVLRIWELACHAWDVYVSRDRNARLHPDAVTIFAGALDELFVPLARDRAATLTTRPIGVKLTDSGTSYTLDPTTERTRVERTAPDADTPLVIEGPDEEIVRFLSGRHFVPGTQPRLKTTKGTDQDLSNLRRAFR